MDKGTDTLNSFEFVIQVFLWKKKEKAVKNYESNCVKEEQLNYILKLYDSHAVRKRLKRVVEELELAEKVEEETKTLNLRVKSAVSDVIAFFNRQK